MGQDDFNNGKDLMPDDIKTEACQFDGKPAVRAYLGFLCFPGKGAAPAKFYQATAETKEQAVNDIIDMMVAHLERVRPKV